MRSAAGFVFEAHDKIENLGSRKRGYHAIEGDDLWVDHALAMNVPGGGRIG